MKLVSSFVPFKPFKVFIHLAQMKRFSSCQLLRPETHVLNNPLQTPRRTTIEKHNTHEKLTVKLASNPRPTLDVVKCCSKKLVVPYVETSTSSSPSAALFSSLVCKKNFLPLIFVSCISCSLSPSLLLFFSQIKPKKRIFK